MLKKLLIAILCALLVIVPFFTAKNILNFEAFKNSTPKDILVLELWHVETFEGGSGNRAKWLEEQATSFKKTHKHINIMVVNLTPEQLVLQFNAGFLPDAISFGVGVGEYIRDKCFPVNGELATPFMMNYYYIIGNGDFMVKAGIGDREDLGNVLSHGGFVNKGKNIDSISIGLKGFNNPLPAVNKLTITEKGLTPYEAYERFVGLKSTFLIGTGRDYIRCKAREEKGKMNNLKYERLEGYTDLVQYFSVINGIDKDNADAVSLFLKYLLSPSVQQSLLDIGMHGVKALPQNTVNAFTSVSAIERLKGEMI